VQFLHHMTNLSALLLDDALLKCFVIRRFQLLLTHRHFTR